MTATYTAFAGYRRLCHGSLADVTRAALAAQAEPHTAPVLIFNDATGHQTDPDARPAAEAAEAPDTPDTAPETDTPPTPKGRGRPKLGVIGREITLLPRHWDWLATQPGGASVVLRRLIDDARRAEAAAPPSPRQRQDATYRFLQAIAGDLPGYENALRALFAGDLPAFSARIEHWPHDLRQYAERLAAG